MRALPALLAALLLGGTLVEPAAARSHPGRDAPPRSAAPYGLVAMSPNGLPGTGVAERTARYRRLRDAGVRAVRLDIPWHRVEPAGEPTGDFDFSAVDPEVEAITAAGLKIVGLLAYGHPDHSSAGATVARTPLAGGLPPFGIGNANHFPPDDPAAFAAFAAAAARHYGDEVVAWEVWNEQNQGWRFWPPREDPAAYGRLLCAASAALREVDRRTPVLFGGLFFPEVAGLPGQGAVRFLRNAYAADPRLGRCFDALAYHPYPYPFTAPELDVPVRGSVLSARDQLQAVLDEHGDGEKGLWITEVGWPTNDRAYGVSERKQAQYVARMAAATFAQRVPALTFYTYGDEQDPTGVNQEAAFGFFGADEAPKPAYTALATLTRVLGDARFVADRSAALGLPPGEQLAGGRGFALQFARGRRRVWAAWLASESVAEGQGPVADQGPHAAARHEVRVPVRARRVTVVSMLGERRVQRSRGGAITLSLGPSPQYVVDRGRPGGRRARPR